MFPKDKKGEKTVYENPIVRDEGSLFDVPGITDTDDEGTFV